ncbi:MAG: DUF3565 domain-containing protein [Myxococcales bacterium]|nr:DUF3565 domain-containing protein [Myxococcales bacterium]MDD9971628.1 DUF3565 domain-containing protein [Myxococcales bacterium]
MKRHPALQGLSREHHQALVFARTLRTDPAADSPGKRFVGRDGAAGPVGGALTEVKQRFHRELAPHFLLEERELLPLSLCGDRELRRLADVLVDQHNALRAGFADPLARLPALGTLLAEHVRFEEREWFPALEARLPADVLSELVHRLKTEPEVPIAGFEQDDEGTWVARLSCGHSRHVRHHPPFQEAVWVMSAAGRADKLGVRLPCRMCRMPRMPPCVEVYKRTPTYDVHSVPDGLLRSHRLRAGSWGRIKVLEGRVHYVLEDEQDCTLILRPDVDGVVAPQRPHHIALEQGARMQVLFCRCSEASESP